VAHCWVIYKALKELQNIRAQRIKERIGFESQKRQQAAAERAAEAHTWKKQQFELKKERLHAANSQNRPAPTPDASPGNLKMAA
jgi:predicted DsbA family dithiol-disulfide isomerase